MDNLSRQYGSAYIKKNRNKRINKGVVISKIAKGEKLRINESDVIDSFKEEQATIGENTHSYTKETFSKNLNKLTNIYPELIQLRDNKIRNNKLYNDIFHEVAKRIESIRLVKKSDEEVIKTRDLINDNLNNLILDNRLLNDEYNDTDAIVFIKEATRAIRSYNMIGLKNKPIQYQDKINALIKNLVDIKKNIMNIKKIKEKV